MFVHITSTSSASAHHHDAYSRKTHRLLTHHLNGQDSDSSRHSTMMTSNDSDHDHDHDHDHHHPQHHDHPQDECGLLYHVQGGNAKLFGRDGVAIMMSGRCWHDEHHDGNNSSSIVVPSGWRVNDDNIICDSRIRSRLLMSSSSSSATHHHDADAAATSSTTTSTTVTPVHNDVCVLRLETSVSGNAYVAVVEALLRDDRSMFTTTEVRHHLAVMYSDDMMILMMIMMIMMMNMTMVMVMEMS